VIILLIAFILFVITHLPLAMFVTPIGFVILWILWLIGIVFALSGEKRQIPLIGRFADKFDI
jgi:uncharacterized membrane protein